MAYTLTFVADFGTKTGLTLRAQLYDTDGSTNGAEIAAGFVEIGNGIYTYTHAALPDNHRGSFVVWDNADATTKVGFGINPEEAEQVKDILDDTGTSGVVIATATQQAIADEALKRGVSNVEDAADTTSLAAVILAILESSVSGSTWTIRKSGGGSFVVKTVTTDAGAAPITGVT